MKAACETGKALTCSRACAPLNSRAEQGGKLTSPKTTGRDADARIALQAVKAAEEAERAWEADVPEKRREALEAAQQAADFAQQTYKHLRLVHN